MRTYKVGSGKLFAVTDDGVQALTDACYQVEYFGDPSRRILKGPMLVAISSKIDGDKAIELLHSLITDIKANRKVRNRHKPYLREY